MCAAVSEVPKPPADVELRNVIDKLAQFVARNGPDFEQMTKNKQKDNPKFGFLFGGPDFAYYQYMVNVGQAMNRKRMQQEQHMQSGTGYGNFASGPPGPQPQAMYRPPMPGGPGPAQGNYPHNMIPPTGYPPNMPNQMQMPPGPSPMPNRQPPPSDPAATIKQLEQQLSDSEKNLKAQYDALMTSQQNDLESAMYRAEEAKVKSTAKDSRLPLDDFECNLGNLTNSCTKDNISEDANITVELRTDLLLELVEIESAKQWIFTNCTTDWQMELILRYMLANVSNPAGQAERRLHILYLLNDWAHHSLRKKTTSVTLLLSGYVPLVYACARHFNKALGSTEKLDKLQSLWQTQNVFNDEAYQRLHDPEQTYQEYCKQLSAEHDLILQPIKKRTMDQYAHYQQQNEQFSRHAQQMIASLTARLPPPSPAPQANMQQESESAQADKQRRSRFDQTQAAAENNDGNNATSWRPAPVDLMFNQNAGAPASNQPPPMSYSDNSASSMNSKMAQPPPSIPLPAELPADHPSLKPKVCYYDLPAGLMVPMVKPADHEYEPLDPELLRRTKMDCRLPQPKPPSDSLLAALDAFYAPPNHERPRDADGWEKLALYEYYQSKKKAIEAVKQNKNSPRSRTNSTGSSRSRSNSSDSRSSRSRSPSPKPKRQAAKTKTVTRTPVNEEGTRRPNRKERRSSKWDKAAA